MACSCLPLCRRSAASGDVYVRRCALYLLACVLSLGTLVDLEEEGGLMVSRCSISAERWCADHHCGFCRRTQSF